MSKNSLPEKSEEQQENTPRPTWEQVFQAFDEAGARDFIIERDRSLPREVNLDLSDEQIDDFTKWVSGLRKQIPFGNDKQEKQ